MQVISIFSKYLKIETKIAINNLNSDIHFSIQTLSINQIL